MWTITVDAAKVEALRKQDWGSDPFLPQRGEGDAYRIRMVDGRCFFLDEEKRCRIHTRLGYAAKPEGCKAFPLHVAEVGGETCLRLSFYCPAVTAGEGKRLVDQNRWLKETVRAAGDVARQQPLRLDDAIELSPRDLDALESALTALLEAREAPVKERLAAGAGLLARLQAAIRERGKSALSASLEEARRAGLAALAAEGRSGGSAARAGPVLALFLGQDCAPGSLARLGHFLGVRLANLGLARLRSTLVGGKASYRAILAVALDPPLPGAGEALLTRYLLHKLRARRPLHGELTLVAGWNLLCAAYAVASVLARLRAVAAGRAACDEEDLRAAVQAADLLVVEHTTLYHGSLVATLTDTVLAQDRLCASLLARLG
jgi:Fe-S-cluster containining protein